MTKSILQWTAIIFIALAQFFITLHAHANDEPELLRRCGQTEFNLCGYIDGDRYRSDSESVFILDPIFENAKDFSEGLAAVRIDGLWGYIDISGEIVISPQFQNAGAFDQGLAIAGTVENLGVIDKSGTSIVEPKFSKAVVLSLIHI